VGLAPHLEKIRAVLSGADKSYKDLDPEVRRVHSKRTRAGNIADYICDHVYKNLLEDPDVKIRRRYGSLRMIVCDKYQLTFKKLNDNLKPSYIPARWRLPLHGSDENKPEFEGMPEGIINLIAGYRWDQLEPSKFYLECPSGSNIIWVLELTGTSESEGMEQAKKGITEKPVVHRKRVFSKGKSKQEKV
jgi:hypothetical protein